jgi:leucyl aminopeptidase
LRSVTGPTIVLVSLGDDDQSTANYRFVGASAVRAAGEGSIAVLLPTEVMKDPAGVAQAIVEGALLASYNFKNHDTSSSVDVVPVGVPLPTVSVHDDVTHGVQRGALVAEAVNWAKFLTDSPAGAMTPKNLASEIEERLGHDAHIEMEVWTEPKIREERLGGLLGVGQGSAQPTRLVYATYDPEPGATLPHVALVGKGVTFDSGGLSMKARESSRSSRADFGYRAVDGEHGW